MELSEKNIKSECRRLEREVKWCKSRILEELVDYRYAVSDLRGALRAYNSAYSRYVKKPVERNREAMNITYRELTGEYAAAQAVKERIISYLDTAAEATTEHRDLLGTNDRAGMLLADRFESYSGGIMSRIAALERGVMDNVPDELTAEPDTAEETEELEENYEQSVARDIEELTRPLPEAATAPVSRADVICEKLAELLKTAEGLVAELSEISAMYAELSGELDALKLDGAEQSAPGLSEADAICDSIDVEPTEDTIDE